MQYGGERFWLVAQKKSKMPLQKSASGTPGNIPTHGEFTLSLEEPHTRPKHTSPGPQGLTAPIGPLAPPCFYTRRSHPASGFFIVFSIKSAEDISTHLKKIKQNKNYSEE